MVDYDGLIMVPRVVPLLPLDPHVTLASRNSSLPATESPILSSVPPSRQGHVRVKVSSCIDLQGGIIGYFGEVVDGSGTTLATGSHILGIVLNESVSTYQSMHMGSLVPLPPLMEPTSLLSSFGAILVLMLAAPSLVSHIDRFSRIRFIVTHRASAIGVALHQVLHSLGLHYETLGSSISVSDFDKIRSTDFVITGFEGEDREILESLMQSTCCRFFWNDSSAGLYAVLSQNPWLFADSASSIINALPIEAVATTSLSGISLFGPRPAAERDSKADFELFDPNRAYLLVGGIGLLGIRIALWMYQVCFATCFGSGFLMTE